MKNKKDYANNYCAKELGDHGESIAATYLIESGYKIIERNFRCKVGEIDIIASKSDIVAFVEVKSRRVLSFGLPQEAVNHKKMQYIRRVASYYLTAKMRMRRLFPDCQFRFDVIEITFVDENYEINHIKDAF